MCRACTYLFQKAGRVCSTLQERLATHHIHIQKLKTNYTREGVLDQRGVDLERMGGVLVLVHTVTGQWNPLQTKRHETDSREGVLELRGEVLVRMGGAPHGVWTSQQ